MLLEADKISKTYFDGRLGLNECSFSVNQGEYVCIVGKSGCGKTTLLNIITGMLAPEAGNVYLDGENIYKDLKQSKRTTLRNDKIGYLNYGNYLIENLTVYDNILYPLLLNGRKCEPNDIHTILDELEIGNIKTSYPRQISAGEYRRAGLARILALDTKILVLDEPTSNLDDKSGEIILNIISRIKKQKNIIVATHDERLMLGRKIELKITPDLR